MIKHTLGGGIDVQRKKSCRQCRQGKVLGQSDKLATYNTTESHRATRNKQTNIEHEELTKRTLDAEPFSSLTKDPSWAASAMLTATLDVLATRTVPVDSLITGEERGITQIRKRYKYNLGKIKHVSDGGYRTMLLSLLNMKQKVRAGRASFIICIFVFISFCFVCQFQLNALK